MYQLAFHLNVADRNIAIIVDITHFTFNSTLLAFVTRSGTGYADFLTQNPALIAVPLPSLPSQTASVPMFPGIADISHLPAHTSSPVPLAQRPSSMTSPTHSQNWPLQSRDAPRGANQEFLSSLNIRVNGHVFKRHFLHRISTSKLTLMDLVDNSMLQSNTAMLDNDLHSEILFLLESGSIPEQTETEDNDEQDIA